MTYSDGWNHGYSSALDDVWDKAESIIDSFDADYAIILADFLERLQNEF